jgi:hypothetical protein
MTNVVEAEGMWQKERWGIWNEHSEQIFFIIQVSW